ncbi:MAG: hypothetical protein NTU79_24970 [Planctomycetota bacterium]|nr:hypothetical protein [Planctomycetota bacterium]
MDTLHQLELEIREYIYHPRVQHVIMRDRRDWMQLCASLDVIGDSQLAIDAYSASTIDRGSGLAYLQVFGLFQAFFLQQDATTHLAEVLQITLPDNAGLREVRDTRNDIVGHPTKRGNKNSRTSHAISRVSLSKWQVDVVSTTPASADIILRTINVHRQLELQLNGVVGRLRQILQEIQTRERKHAMNFTDHKLADIFPQTMSYHCGKISEGIHRSSDIPLARVNLEMVNSWVETFRTALTDRDELPGNEFIQYHFDQLQNPFDRLRGFFDGNSPLNAEDAYAIAFFLHAKIKELAEIAAQFDETYTNQ